MGIERKITPITPVMRSIVQGLGREIVLAANRVKAEAEIDIRTGQKTGRLYKRGKKMHQASAAGEAPAVDEGLLANSIEARRTGALSAEVSVGAEYAAALEFGTSKMEPRPFLYPAGQKVAPKLTAGASKAVQEALAKYGSRK